VIARASHREMELEEIKRSLRARSGNALSDLMKGKKCL